jgi:hypothetical protein
MTTDPAGPAPGSPEAFEHLMASINGLTPQQRDFLLAEMSVPRYALRVGQVDADSGETHYQTVWHLHGDDELHSHLRRCGVPPEWVARMQPGADGDWQGVRDGGTRRLVWATMPPGGIHEFALTGYVFRLEVTGPGEGEEDPPFLVRSVDTGHVVAAGNDLGDVEDRARADIKALANLLNSHHR